MESTAAVEWLGYIAGSCTALSFLPQVLRTWRTRSAADLSLGMLSLYLLSTVLWLVYGWLTRAWPVLATNLAIFLLTGLILGMKLMFRGRGP